MTENWSEQFCLLTSFANRPYTHFHTQYILLYIYLSMYIMIPYVFLNFIPISHIFITWNNNSLGAPLWGKLSTEIYSEQYDVHKFFEHWSLSQHLAEKFSQTIAKRRHQRRCLRDKQERKKNDKEEEEEEEGLRREEETLKRLTLWPHVIQALQVSDEEKKNIKKKKKKKRKIREEKSHHSFKRFLNYFHTQQSDYYFIDDFNI